MSTYLGPPIRDLASFRTAIFVRPLFAKWRRIYGHLESAKQLPLGNRPSR